jgi:hypothetical protein
VTANGNIVVESTGTCRHRTRTVKAFVRRSGFVDFVYFTDFEVRDPLDYRGRPARPRPTHCATYFGLRTRSFACRDLRFSNDTLAGPVHSNDTMMICNNVTFKDVVTTMSGPVAANGNRNYRVDGCGTAGTGGTTVRRAGRPGQRHKVNLPSTNLGPQGRDQ